MIDTVQFKKSYSIQQGNKVIQRNSKKENSQTDDVLDGIQTAIDVIGFVPGVGDIADGVNAGISIVRKDWWGAVFSGIALIPIIGSAIAVPMKTISKVGGKIGSLSKTVKNAIKQLVKLLGGAKKVTSKLNGYLKDLKGLLRKLPNLMKSVANSRFVKWLAGKKVVKTFLAFAKKIKNGINTVFEKAEEVFLNVKKVITKGTAKAAKLPNTSFTINKLQHEFKHAGDFRVTGNWNKVTGEIYQKAIQKHIDTAKDVYKSTYRGQDVYVYINKSTGVGEYTDLLGNYVGGWKFSSDQINFHLKNGAKIK